MTDAIAIEEKIKANWPRAVLALEMSGVTLKTAELGVSIIIVALDGADKIGRADLCVKVISSLLTHFDITIVGGQFDGICAFAYLTKVITLPDDKEFLELTDSYKKFMKEREADALHLHRID